MPTDFSIDSIQLNGRLVRLEDIASNSVEAQTSFEREMIKFVHDWITGEETFQLQTSGSTGEPKKIIVTRLQMIASASMTIEALSLKKGDVAWLCMDAKYVGARMMVVRSFVSGMQLIVTDPVADPLAYLPPHQCVNFAAFVPYQLKHALVSEHRQRFSQIKKLIIGGAALDQKTIHHLQSLPTACYATYGMTETISHVALQKLNGADRQDHFTALPGIGVDTDARGCLVINVPFVKDKIITNDVVVLYGAGVFEVTGRFDNIINSGGIKVSPEKLEATIQDILERSSIDLKFFIHAQPDELLGQKLVWVVETPSHTVDYLLSLHTLLSKEIQKYYVPKVLAITDRLVYTETGKINRVQSFESVKEFVTIPPSALR